MNRFISVCLSVELLRKTQNTWPVAFDLSQNNDRPGENGRLQLATLVISIANAMLATLLISMAYAMLATLAKEDTSLLIACFYRHPRI